MGNHYFDSEFFGISHIAKRFLLHLSLVIWPTSVVRRYDHALHGEHHGLHGERAVVICITSLFIISFQQPNEYKMNLLGKSVFCFFFTFLLILVVRDEWHMYINLLYMYIRTVSDDFRLWQLHFIKICRLNFIRYLEKNQREIAL